MSLNSFDRCPKTAVHVYIPEEMASRFNIHITKITSIIVFSLKLNNYLIVGIILVMYLHWKFHSSLSSVAEFTFS